MNTEVIVVAAGSGTRMNAATPKPLLPLKNKPMLIHCLETFQAVTAVRSIILVVPSEQLTRFQDVIRVYPLNKVKVLVPGGATRCESVANGLKHVDRLTEVVLVHDGARPLITAAKVEEALSLMVKEQAVILAVPVKATVKRADPKNLYVSETLPRETLWEVQTPQAFRKDVLFKAHEAMLCCEPTDDAVLVEKLGIKVKILNGDYRNIKVTTPEDLLVAERLLGPS